MEFDEKNELYKKIMLVLVTAMITFLITSMGISNYYKKTEQGLEKVVEVNDTASTLDTKIQIIRACLNKKYLGEIPDDEKLWEWAVKGYVEGLDDEYTEYLTKDEYEELLTSVEGNYIGIGVYIIQDRQGNIYILYPIDESPAEKAGLKTGDIINKVDGEECKGLDLNLVASKIKGEEGSKVTLEILRAEETFTIELERKTVKLNQLKTEVLENNIGYIRIRSFDENCSAEFKEKLDELLNKNIKSLIIDIRDNGGGIVSEANEIADLFVPKDKIIMRKIGKEEEEEIIKAQKDVKISDLKIVLLENENSASASEILIGALKENEIATVVGETSFGKGLMQEIIPLSTGGALKVTIQEFRTPNGNVIDKEGIEPNIKVEDDTKTEKDEQLQKAIEECKK